jgi:DNA-binding helix-hairpin-helix protein with protein kinase domain
MPPQLFVNGKSVHLGRRIGKGGEGEVYALADDPQRAVKLYTAHDGFDREAKISAIVRMRLGEKSNLVAFPLALARDQRGGFHRFVMHLVRDHEPIFELYSPGARKQRFPQAGYRFLTRAALNTAKAIAAVHAAGCVIGDINHSGVLISKNATAALIDADSFQVIDGLERYLCRVGVPEYTPPELQGKSLSAVVRTFNHDAFGLAIVIFQLLAMGRHPFVGSYSRGEMPIQKAIAEFRFAYSEQRHACMTPPPGACTLKDFTPEVAAAFESAFGQSQQANRPSALHWVGLLESFERTLKKCSANSLHQYSSAAPACPWCRMEQRLGVVLFLPNYTDFATVPPSSIGTGTFNLATLWAQIEAIRVPSRAHLTPQLPTLSLSPSTDALQAKRRRYEPYAIRAGAIIAAVAIVAVVPNLWLLAFGVAAAGFFYAKQHGDPSSLFRQRFSSIEQEWHAALDQWERRCGIERVEELKASLQNSESGYENLQREEAQRIAGYQAQRQALQRNQYLDAFRIRDTKITGIGPAKLATLASYGIETAADITQEKVLAVPGIGPINSQPLLQWARECAQGFVYNTQQTAADRMELGKIRADIERTARELRDKLTIGAREYAQAAQASQRMVSQPDAHLTSVHTKRIQIETDLRFLGIALPTRPPRPSRTVKTQPLPAQQQTTRPTSHTAPYTGTPSCPLCNSRMVRRTARRGRRSGNQFWGCSRYPNCRGTRPI